MLKKKTLQLSKRRLLHDTKERHYDCRNVSYYMMLKIKTLRLLKRQLLYDAKDKDITIAETLVTI